jgi:hypothetical protein
VEFDVKVEEDRDESLRAPVFECVLGFPDVEHLDLAVRVDGGVVEPADRATLPSRIEPADGFVVLLRGEPAVPEVCGRSAAARADRGRQIDLFTRGPWPGPARASPGLPPRRAGARGQRPRLPGPACR